MGEMRKAYDVEGFELDWDEIYAGVRWERKVCWSGSGVENCCNDLTVVR